jgi:two-component system, OmpR family, phosphate regulon sensor histidine kinase PhoR
LSSHVEIEIISKELDEGLILLDSDANVIYANPKALSYFGERILSKPIYNFIRAPQLIDLINTEKKPKIFEYIHHGNTIQTYVITIIPLTEKSIALKIADYSQREAFENVRKEFIANVSHELRSPLTSIIGFIETLQTQEVPKDKSNHFLKIIQDESNRMSRILDDLLSLSKLEINAYIKPVNEIDILENLNIVLSTMEIRLKEKKIEVKLNMGSKNTFKSKIRGDFDEITQVFNNLIDNAIKYSPENKTISIDVSYNKKNNKLNTIVISISNEGIGISEEHLPRLTERFYRIDKDRSRTVGGTGLGLAIVKHIMHRHDGELFIESTPNKKTTFSINFPCIS